MVCYARRATGILSIGIVALFLYGADTAHLFDVAGLLISLAVVLGGAAVAAVAVYVALRSVRHKRALAGGCVSCQLRCQHAMTGDPGWRSSSSAASASASAGSGRMWLVSSVERRAAAVPAASAGAGRPVFVPLPRVPAERVRVPAERVRVRAGAAAPAGGAAPRWPDLPARNPSASPAPLAASASPVTTAPRFDG